MEYAPKGFGDFARGVRRRPLMLLSIGSVITAVAFALALYLPPVYKSTAIILIEQQEIPQDLVRSTVTSYADQRIQSIGQRVMTSSNLMEIVKKYGLYGRELAENPREVVLADMREAIRLDRISADVVDPQSGAAKKATVAFTLSFSSEHPDVAQKVANELVSLYLNENLRSRTATAEQASAFLKQENDRLRAALADVEQKLVEFKERNAGNLPELTPVNAQILERTQAELQDNERMRRSMEQRHLELRSQLAQLEALARRGEEQMLLTSTGQRILPPREQLKGLELELVNLRARYAKGHPDVVRLEKEIAALQTLIAGSAPEDESAELQAKRAELASARERYSDQHPDVRRLQLEVAKLEETPPAEKDETLDTLRMPAILQVRTDLAAIESELAALLKRQEGLRVKAEEYEQRLTQAPRLEQEYVSLNQQRTALLQNIAESARRIEQASMAQSLEEERQGEKLTLIEPPSLPETPASPNRRAIAGMGIALGLIGSIGSTVLAEVLDTSIRGGRTVAALVSVPPLGLIPRIDTLEDRRRRLRRRLLAAVLVLALLIGGLLGVHFLWRPLDLLWYQIMFRMAA